MGTAPDWERHPADVARLVFTLTITAGLTLFAWVLNDPLNKAGTDLIRLLANIPAGFTSALVGLVQLVVVASVAVVSVTLLLRRRWRLITLYAVAAGLAVAVMLALAGLLDNEIPVDLAGQRAVDSWLSGSAFPSAPLLAAAAAVVTASASFSTAAWHRFAWATVGAISFLRVLTATEVPVNLLLILAVGASMGSAALLIAGAPHRRIDPEAVTEALARAGLPVAEIFNVGQQRKAPTFRAHHLDGSQTHVGLLGRDQRDYDMLLRFWRLLRVKGFNERRPRSSPRRAAEHEQLVLALAGGAGVSAAKPVALGLTDDGASVVATTWVDGESLGRTPAADITDELLTEVWEQVAKLHARRIAHRWLNLDSIMVLDGHPVLVGFRWGTTSADDTILGADVAELLSALSAHVGIERAVQSAYSGLGREALLAAVPLIQPLVIAAETRDKLAESDIAVGQIREAVGEVLDTGEVLLAPLNRVSLKGVVSLVGSGVLVFYVLSLASDWRSIGDALASMNLAVIPLLLVLVLVANAGGALTMMGSVNIELAFLRTNLIMFAQGFLNRFTPANAGGMALRARYLQREGVELSVGAAAVGLGSAASGVVQVVFIIVFLIWGGASDQLGDFELPSATKILGLILIVGIVVGAIGLSGWGRRVIIPKARQALGPALASLAALSRQPGKMGLLFGGSALAKLATIAAFAATANAFGVDLSFARLGAVYMIANTIGAAVPTPGGVGGIEAALTAALISAGVDSATAGAVVLVFRLFTFWLPTLPGWACLRSAQRTGIV